MVIGLVLQEGMGRLNDRSRFHCHRILDLLGVLGLANVQGDLAMSARRDKWLQGVRPAAVGFWFSAALSQAAASGLIEFLGQRPRTIGEMGLFLATRGRVS